MTESNHLQMIQPEIVAPPSVSNLAVTQVGTGMFSVAMQVIMVVRFPPGAPVSETVGSNTDRSIPQMPVGASNMVQAAAGELVYANGQPPNAFDGEREGFQAFVQVHGYVPASRDILIQWAANSQGGV